MTEDRQVKQSSISGFDHINRFWDAHHEMTVAKILPGEYYVTTANEWVVTGLGSCVAVCIRDRERGVGGMNHFMLPDNQLQKLKSLTETIIGSATRYGNHAMEHLINTILNHGGKRKNLEAKIFGGAKIDVGGSVVGSNNVDFGLEYIDAEAITLVAKDLGGNCPRKVIYYPKTGQAWIKKLADLENESLLQQERKYYKSIKDASVVSKIELF